MKKKIQKPDRKLLEKQLKALIAEVLEISPKKVTPKADFQKDLGMDSMRALEILAAVEKTYKIEIPEERLAEIKSFDQVIALTEEFLAKKNGPHKSDKKKKKRKKV